MSKGQIIKNTYAVAEMRPHFSNFSVLFGLILGEEHKGQ